jgi:AraC-like DNA-binding protein
MDLSCSARLIHPFIRFAGANETRRELVPDGFWTAQADARVSLEMAQSMLDRGVEHTKDNQLGLKIGSSMRFGHGGTFDYIVRSAANIESAVSVASKYSRLLSDDFHLSFETWRSRGFVRLDGVWPRSSAEFAMGSLFSIHLSDLAPQLEAWFPHVAPTDTNVHEALFPGVPLRFGAPFYGFGFAEEFARFPLPGGDPDVHAVLVARADRMLEELTSQKTISAAVQRFVVRDLRDGGPTPESVARVLRMSARTLSRRLAGEGTTFNALVEQVRRERAIELLRDPKVSLTEVAFLLGFSHVESFYRAFKRWTGTTPLLHRHALLMA